MFNLRTWYIKNTPHKYYSEKYSHEMAILHNEINYKHSRLMLRNTMITAVFVFGFIMFAWQEGSRDWKDEFDLKFNQKIYGSIAESSGEGGSSIDDWYSRNNDYSYPKILYDQINIHSLKFIKKNQSLIKLIKVRPSLTVKIFRVSVLYFSLTLSLWAITKNYGLLCW